MMLALLTIKRLEGMDQIHRLQVIRITQGEEEARYLVEELVGTHGVVVKMGGMVVLEGEVQEGLKWVEAVVQVGTDTEEKVVLEVEAEAEQGVLTVVVFRHIQKDQEV